MDSYAGITTRYRYRRIPRGLVTLAMSVAGLVSFQLIGTR